MLVEHNNSLGDIVKAFVNRKSELASLDQCQNRGGGLIVLYGRRRVGKTALLRHWLGKRKSCYSQAIEGHPLLQVEQISNDIAEVMDFPILPKTWTDFFNVLKKSAGPWILCIDEFQYLAESSPELRSFDPQRLNTHTCRILAVTYARPRHRQQPTSLRAKRPYNENSPHGV